MFSETSTKTKHLHTTDGKKDIFSLNVDLLVFKVKPYQLKKDTLTEVGT